MGNQRLRILLLTSFAGLALSLAACTRSASVPAGTQLAEATTPVELNPQQATMEAVRSALLTQTAEARQASATETASTPTGAPEASPSPAPTNTPAPVASPGAGRPNRYILREGEHPFCIARRFNVDPGELLSINGLSLVSLIQPGTTLNIPQTGNRFPGNRALRVHPTTYTVVAGDTLNVIACLFGDVRPLAIARANGLEQPYTLRPGTVLNIP